MPNKYNYNTKAFTQNNALSYYLLGAFITDGNVKRNLEACSISSNDGDWLRLINNVVSQQNICKSRKYSKCKTLTIYNKEICSWLVSNECVPNKSLKVKFPNMPDKYFRDFIRGCMDGDGSISFYTNKVGRKILSCYLCGVSVLFINDVFSKLKEFNLRPCLYKTPLSKLKPSIINGKLATPTTPMYRICFSNRIAVKFLQWIYYDDNLLCLNRKRQVAIKGLVHAEKMDQKKTSRFRGVSWHKRAKKWRATLMLNYKQIHAGLFINELDAAKAYDQKAIEIFGSKAILNF
jgi:hypothetical protein